MWEVPLPVVELDGELVSPQAANSPNAKTKDNNAPRYFNDFFIFSINQGKGESVACHFFAFTHFLPLLVGVENAVV